jgi:Domain of unknown function DUF29
MGTKQQPDSGLYDRDFYSWALEQASALREHRVEDLDWENLADEVGDLARSERRAFRSRCVRLIEHLLKMALVPQPTAHNSRLWKLTVKEARREIRELLIECPGLQPSTEDLFSSAWSIGRLEALKFLDLAEDAVAEAPLWSFAQAMDENFIPVT